MSVDNRLPTNQSQLDIASKLDDVKTAIENINIGGSTVVANPSGTATADLTKLQVDNEIYGIPSGGSGGHTILDDDGTVLAQEDNLQFKGVYSTDNSEDGVTEVNVYREMTKAEFNLLSSDEKKGFIRVTDEPDIYSDGHFQPVIYSTEEREIGVWTDGKPLYKRTYELSSSFVINAQTWGTTSIDVSFVDKIIGEADIVTAGGQGYVCFTDISNNNLQLYNPRHDAGIGVKFITIQYTKSTDIAGSGTWTPQEVPTHHYSTDEQIIGTWIDGSTLYEKTFYIHDRQFNSSGECDFDVTALNSDILMADNMASYYTFSISSTEYRRQFEKLVPEEGHVYAYGPANRQITTGYVTIQYTKS